MVKWGPVIVGFILAIILANLFSHYVNSDWGTNLGLFIAGFIVGLWVHDGILGGLWNANTVAGSLRSNSISITIRYWRNNLRRSCWPCYRLSVRCNPSNWSINCEYNIYGYWRSHRWITKWT